MASLTLHAQPYAYGGSGFYFSDLDEYEKKEAKSPHEEWMIQFIDGDDTELAVFNAMDVNQSNLDDYFDTIDDIEEHQLPALSYLMGEVGYSFDDAMEKLDDVYLADGTAEDYVHEWVHDLGGPSEVGNNDYYFDHQGYGRDASINGTWDPRNDDQYEGVDEEEPDEDDYEAGSDLYDDAYEAWEEYKQALDWYDAMDEEELGSYIIDDVYGGLDQLPDADIAMYFRYDALARDLLLGGDWREYSFAGQDYVVTNANDV